MIRIRIGQSAADALGADMDIPALLRALKSDARMRQEEIAHALQISQSTVSRISNGRQNPSHDIAAKIAQLAATKGFLTNNNIISRVVSSIEVRGHMTITDEVVAVSDGQPVEQVDLPFSVPAGCFAVIVEGDGLTSRARKGDLIIAGPTGQSPNKMLDAEGVFKLSDGRCYFGILMESRHPDRFTILCQHNRRISDADVIEAGPFFAVVAAGRWQSMI